MTKRAIKYYIGIDEVGRGPLAGPVTIGAFLVSDKNLKEYKKKIKNKNRKGRDSKKLSKKEREDWYKFLYKERKDGNVNFVTVSLSAKKIDEEGISWCIRKAIATSLSRLKNKNRFDLSEVKVSLDGSLKAPEEYIYQETIIKGDEKNDLIAAASIVAKVTRDKFMKKLSLDNKLSKYGFETHKGYGTLSHRKAIKKYGKSEFHRKSFCKNI